MKTKIAVAGCPNSCTKPQLNDIGFAGVIEPRFEENLCSQCGLCAEICPSKAIKMVNGRPAFGAKKCIREGNCIFSCPFDAWKELRRGYRVCAGGKAGKFPRMGNEVLDFIEEHEAPLAVEAVLNAFERLARSGERIADVTERLGNKCFKKEVAYEFALLKKAKARPQALSKESSKSGRDVCEADLR